MKSSILGSFFLALFIIYIGYVFLPSDDYIRIKHACSPVNMFGQTVQSGQRTVGGQEPVSSLTWFQKAEHTCQLFVYDRFYAKH
jgi:hypothetical protein